MARKVIRNDESYQIEFETAGNGTYWVVPKARGEEPRGPYADEEAAMRAAIGYLERKIGRAGDELQDTMREDEEATRRAIAEAERREREEREAPKVATSDFRPADEEELFRPQLPPPKYEPQPNRSAEGAEAPEPKRAVDVRKVRAIRPRIEE